jgi:hypothetical protein
MNVRGISNEIERTLGEVDAKLMIGNCETEHKFQVVEGINIPYDGILGKDFFESKKATINYMRKKIMGKVVLKFDRERQLEESNQEVWVILKPRCETIVRLRTRSKELESGLINRTEIAPGIITAGTLTIVREGTCLTSIVNMNDKEEDVALPIVDLEQCDTETSGLLVGTVNTQTEISTKDRLRELRNSGQIT